MNDNLNYIVENWESFQKHNPSPSKKEVEFMKNAHNECRREFILECIKNGEISLEYQLEYTTEEERNDKQIVLISE
jgi:hypothetical protein